MTFLTPIPALIAAAVVAPALLALYLLKLRRRPVRVSSTLLWTARTRDLQVNVPLRWLRPSWLLLLQLLILALFLIALARPVIRTEGPPPQRVVLVIDRSASMSARDGAGGGTRLDEARSAAARFVDALGAGGSTEACVVELAHEARAATGFLRDRAALKAAIRAVEPTDQPADLAPALRLAGALLAADATGAEEAPARAPALVVLFSDGSFAASEPLTLGGAEFRFERAGPPASPPGERDNLGIVAVAARRDYEDPGAVRVFARVQNAGTAAASAPLVLTLDGEVVERRAVTVPGASGDAPGGHGQVGVSMEARTTGGGVLAVTLAHDDALDADNGAAIVLAPAARPRIVLVIPDQEPGPEPAQGEGPEWLIADPLRELRARSLRIIPAAAYEAGAASNADLVVFDRVRPSRLPLGVPSLSFGTGIPIPGADAEPGAGGGQATQVLAWERSSPVLRNVSLDSLFISGPLRLSEAEGAEIVELARGRDGPLILEVRDGATRRLVVAFELARSNWPVDFGFPIFLADAVDYLTVRGEDQVSGGAATFTTTQPVDITVSGGAREVVLRGPVEVRVPLPEDAGTAPRRIGVGVLPRAGVYRIDAGGEGEGGGDGGRAIAVNLLDEGESAIATADTLRVSGESVSAAVGGGGSGPREIWDWFVLAALLLLALEWFLHAWMMRV